MEEQHQYRSWIEVDLDHFISNLKEVRRLIGPDVKILQVVKADAYGHGAIEISQTALKNGACCLGVANADEGVQLRVGGITAPIIILSPSTNSETPEIIKYNLTPSVSDVFFARDLERLCQKAGIKAKIHIEVDTGMGRCGSLNRDTIKMINEIIDLPHLEIEGIFTHLSQSETLVTAGKTKEDKGGITDENVDYNQRQWLLFRELRNELERQGLHIPLCHIANSGAILNYPDFHLDMVRPGLMTYGIYPSLETRERARLLPVMSFKTRILLLKDFPPGCGIGYGGTFVTRRPTKIATLPVGYGDGYGFLLSNQGEAIIRGKKAPVVGRISMDLCTLDVSHIPDCRVGDEVVMLGRQSDEEITADEVAGKARTISYEVICALGKRAPRIFLRDGNKDLVAPRLRRIFVPQDEKSISRIDNIIRYCLQTRAHSEDMGDALYYTMFETLFGKEERQLELRRNFKYHIQLEEFSPAQPFFLVKTRVEYYKTLKHQVFFIGCAGSNEQLAAFFEDERCEYRWLLNNDGNLTATKDFRITSLSIDDEEVSPLREEIVQGGYKFWFGGDQLKKKPTEECKIELEIATKKVKRRRDLSIFLNYPVRGLEIVFDHEKAELKNLREIAFFAGKHPSPAIVRKKGLTKLSIDDNEWVFPTSGVTFIWD